MSGTGAAGRITDQPAPDGDETAKPCSHPHCPGERDGTPVDPGPRSEMWRRAAERARLLAWFSLLWMTGEGVLGIVAGLASGSVALVAWALGSAVEGLASVIVVWRFTGSRTLSPSAERRAQKFVAISFFLLAPYITVQALGGLIAGRHPETSVLGIAITSSSILVMPVLAMAKRRLSRTLDSGATAGEGMQNMLCATQAGAVLLGLALTAWIGWWWIDPVVALGLAVLALREGRRTWRGEYCC